MSYVLVVVDVVGLDCLCIYFVTPLSKNYIEHGVRVCVCVCVRVCVCV